MPVKNMAEAMCLLPPPHEHRPVTRQTPSSVLIAGEAQALVPPGLVGSEQGFHHVEH